MMLSALLIASMFAVAISRSAKQSGDDIYDIRSLDAGHVGQSDTVATFDLIIAVTGSFFALRALQSKMKNPKHQKVWMPKNITSPCSTLQATSHKSPVNMHNNFKVVGSKAQNALTPKSTPSRCSKPTLQTPPRIGKDKIQEVIRDIARHGRPEQLKQILDQGYHMAVGDDPEQLHAISVAEDHVLCAVKACAAYKYYSEGLDIYDHCKNRIGSGSASLWSCLLFCASRIEQQVHRCEHFYSNLCLLESPQVMDLVNLSRLFAFAHNLNGLRAALAHFVQQNGPVDCTTCNALMGICAKKGATALVEELASDRWSEAKDTVSYNTLMTCYMKAKRQQECFRVFEDMRYAKAAPDQFTVGILLDCCIQTHPIDIQHMMSILDVLQAEGVTMNHVHYTSLIKGFVQAGLVQNALEVLELMRHQPTLRPDLVTYSTVVKGLAELGDVDGVFGWLNKLTQEGMMFDNKFFNIILLAFSKCSVPPARVKETLDRLLSLGFKPEAGTLSVLIKAFVLSCSWSEALQLIKDAKLQFDIQPHQRQYIQLAKACWEARQRECLLKTCTAYFEDSKSRGENVPGTVIRKMRFYCKTSGVGEAYNKIVFDLKC